MVASGSEGDLYSDALVAIHASWRFSFGLPSSDDRTRCISFGGGTCLTRVQLRQFPVSDWAITFPTVQFIAEFRLPPPPQLQGPHPRDRMPPLPPPPSLSLHRPPLSPPHPRRPTPPSRHTHPPECSGSTPSTSPCWRRGPSRTARRTSPPTAAARRSAWRPGPAAATPEGGGAEAGLVATRERGRPARGMCA